MIDKQTFEVGERYFSDHYGCTFTITRRTPKSIFYIVDDCKPQMRNRLNYKKEQRSKIYDYSPYYETFSFPIGFVHRDEVEEVW